MTAITGPITKKDMEEFKATLEEEARTAATKTDADDEDTLENQEPKKPEPKFLEDNVDWKKRYADQTRHTNEILARERKEKEELAAKIKALQEQQEARSASQDDNIIENFDKEFTEVSPVLKAYSKKAIEQAKAEAQKLIEDEKKRQQDEALKQAQKAQRLSEAHPDWAALKSDEIFNDWYSQQSASVHKLGSSDDVEDVILVLDMFKQQVKPKKTGPDKKELTQAVVVKSQADIPDNKVGFSIKTFEKEFAKAQQANNGAKMEKLLAAWEKAAAENRLTP